MPIGNGDLGANVWVEASGDVVLYLSKTDAFSENHRLLKLGRVRVKLDPPLLADGATFTQTLDPTAGVIRIETVLEDREVTLRFWVDAHHPVVHLDVEADEPVGMTATAEVWRTERMELTGRYRGSAYGIHDSGAGPVFVEPDTIAADSPDEVLVYHRNVRSLWADNLKLQALGDQIDGARDPLLGRTFGFAMRGDGLTKASDTALESGTPRERWSLAIHALTAVTDTAEAWREALTAQIDRVESIDHARRFAAHKEWWGKFWGRSWIEIDGDAKADRITRTYALLRWMYACTGRGGMPIKFNGSIFNTGDRGIDADFRLWGGPYWWQNTRLSYWPMLYAGDAEMMRPLFKLYRDALPLRDAATQRYYGHGGAFYPETMYLWGAYVDANYGRNREGKPDGQTDNLFIRRYWQSGIELVMMMLDYHDHTGHHAFRDDTLLPLAVAITTFFNEHWPRDDGGKIRFDPAQSLETWFVATNPMPEVAGLRKVLPRLMELPVDAEQRAVWADMLDDLPPIPTRTIDGRPMLAAAEKWTPTKKNVENPELYAVFPYRQNTVIQGGRAVDLALNAWPHRLHKDNVGWHQNAIQAAMLGLTDQAAALVYQGMTATDRGYRFPAMFGGYGFVPDQDKAGVNLIALQRMLMLCDDDVIRLFPAWPPAWNVRFKLHAPHQTVVEGEYRDGKLTALRVKPEARRADVVLPEGWAAQR